ncbi:MAG: cytochrome c peroxidase, partial [Patescibacteria group bacterium]|nr:cytochrome c peroxidase [Patescibacteria group bacterium]
MTRLSWLDACGLLLSAILVLQVGCGGPAQPPKPTVESEEPETVSEEASGESGETLPSDTAASAETPAPAETPASEPVEATAPAVATAGLPVIPLGLPELTIPEDNPMTPEKIELGRLLYFDKRVSRDGTVSCATCHDPQMAWAERRATSAGITGEDGHPLVGNRNSPTIINAAYAPNQFWDGRAATLEEQAVGPVGNSIEMGSSMDNVVTSFNEIAGYKELFQKVFGTDVTEDGFAKAIAAFERTILSGNSPYDKFKAGDEGALTDAQKRGMAAFDEYCAVCHAPPIFSNFQFHNAGVGADLPEPDKGRMDVTGNKRDMGRMRVPALREVANTAPYFHNGSVMTLEESVDLYVRGG